MLKLEQLVLLIACYLISMQLGHPWWLFLALLLLPDVSMVGYAISSRWGATLYNLFHHQGVAIVIIGVGWWVNQPYVLLAGIILLGHSAMDRVFGYGLKYSTGFKHTHLGLIGEPKAKS